RTLRGGGVGQRGQVQQEEGQLEGAPAAVVCKVHPVHAGGEGDLGVSLGGDAVHALAVHDPVGESEGGQCLGGGFEQVDGGGDPVRCVFGLVHVGFGQGTEVGPVVP